MSIVTTFSLRLDMQSWGYLGLQRSQLYVVRSTPSAVDLNSNFDPNAFVSAPAAGTYALYLQLRGAGFGDPDPATNGIPRSGTVTGVTLSAQFGGVVAFDQLSMPVAQLLDILASGDGARLRDALLGGDDEVNGSTRDGGLFGDVGDRLLGLAGNDTLNGRGGHDTLSGGAGDDLIRTTDGQTAPASQVDGGDGLDTLAYDRSPNAVAVDLTSGRVASDTFTSIERVIGSVFADTLTGSPAADTLAGGGGGDSLSGQAGDDVFVGSGGATINGGDGIDTLTYAQRATGVAADLAGGAGADQVTRVERLIGTAHADQLRGSPDADTLVGGGGADSVFGGASDDVILAASGATYLRGDEGNDSVAGGFDFDDINGNMGNDTASGGAGEDWVVGGKDSDLLFGDAAYDVVYGNLGNDTCDGGDGNDIVRGGQDHDIVHGGVGDDYVSGDKGDDTVTGGTGADNFHTFGDAGIDRVTDFSLAEGDRVQLDPGTQFTVAQVGSDTVISMTGGGQMILVGVSMGSLTPGWIFGG